MDKRRTKNSHFKHDAISMKLKAYQKNSHLPSSDGKDAKITKKTRQLTEHEKELEFIYKQAVSNIEQN